MIYRKPSFGNQSEEGEQRTSRLLSASITRRLQHRSLFAYTSELLAAHARGDPVPLLAYFVRKKSWWEEAKRPRRNGFGAAVCMSGLLWSRER